MARTPKRLAVDVTPEQHARFKKEAADLGVTLSALMEHRLFGGPLVDRPTGRPPLPENAELPFPKAS